MGIRRQVSAEGWREFWRWTLVDLVPQLAQEAGRNDVDVLAASVESVKLEPVEGERDREAVEVFTFGLVVNVGGRKARPEQRRYEYARDVATLEDRGLAKARLRRTL